MRKKSSSKRVRVPQATIARIEHAIIKIAKYIELGEWRGVEDEIRGILKQPN